MGLDDIRKRIDEIDSSLLPLFEARLRLAEEVAEYKRVNGGGVLRPEREREVIDKAVSMLEDSGNALYAEQFMRSVMDISKDLQRVRLMREQPVPPRAPLDISGRVGFFGDEGSFTESAAISYFGEDSVRVPCDTFAKVFKLVQSGTVSYGVVPIENSSTGAISEVYDLLGQYDFFIIGEKWVRVRQQLAGIKGASIEEVREVYSHPQGLKQCADFFGSYPGIKLIPYHNTAQSAAYVSVCGDRSKAAVCSERAARMNNLEILRRDINTQSDNYTRFIVISPSMCEGECDKISVTFTLGNRPGTLLNALRYLSIYNVNMTRLESRPQRNNPGNYVFYVDISGEMKQAELALALLKDSCLSYKLLGEYKKDVIEE
ncbi:MAG: chorismate mutase [Clostridia bacterium]|nr:chorismate mutase [Clostridia bacterium]